MEFSMPLRVYIEDTDAGGIVYYVNYLKYMERARTEFMRDLGYDKTAIFDENAMFVVASTSVDYLGSAILDDELQATARPVRVGKASIDFEQLVRRGEDILCKGRVRIACVSKQDRSPTAMPREMYEQVQNSLPG
jgi:4-hydroxybenzoyl-CoA thioesterase/acyl-CoA thioester hydrolase